MSIKKTLQNKNKKRFTKEEYKYIEPVWNVKNYICLLYTSDAADEL